MFKLRNPLTAVPLKYGLVGTVLTIASIVVMYLFVRHPMAVIASNPLLDIRIPLYALLIFASLKEFKDYHGAGILHFWQALVIGVVVYMITSLGSGIFIYIFSEIDSSQFLSKYIEQTKYYFDLNKAEYIAQLGEARYNQAIEGVDRITALSLTSQYLLQSTLIGLFLTFLMAVLMRKKISN